MTAIDFIPMATDKPEARVLRLLESLLVIRKVRLVALERHLDLSAGTIRRIFKGEIELKYRMVIEVLDILEIPPLTFFQIAYGADTTTEGMVAKLDHIRPSDSAAAVGVERFSRSDLQELIKATLTESLTETLAKLGIGPHPEISGLPPSKTTARPAAESGRPRRPKPKKTDPRPE
ncbi:MAG: hypothetical protein JF614_32715 [Acidobacteria bacterium]|nr:hypothetical protein [Acidobacteriota bacterium]